jgi:carboxypeptidase Q
VYNPASPVSFSSSLPSSHPLTYPYSLPIPLSFVQQALNWTRDPAREIDGLVVTEEPTFVPKWVRGEEWATMLSPRYKKLHMVGLGMSVNTSGVNITAEVIVVNDYNDIVANCSKIQGKMLLINTPFTEYGITVAIRENAGNWGYMCGAVATLIRSVGPYSLQNPHTGATNASAPIPSAAVSVEDASQMARMQARGQTIVVSLYMESIWYPPSPSRNILIDIPGTDYPDEYVLVSGHGDSWDIAEGAMDDGGGFVSAWEAVRTIKMLRLKPKRTVRAVVWVNEENGAAGGNQYANDMSASGALDKHSFVFETDSGAFQPYGIGLSCACGPNGCQNGGCGAAKAQLTMIGNALLASIGSGNVSDGGDGTDIGPSCALGVPCIGLNVYDPRLTPDSNNPCTVDSMGAWTNPTAQGSMQYDSQYFWIHHSQADTMERMDPRQLNSVAASLAVWAYSVAQLPGLLPRDAPAPPTPPPENSNSGSMAGPVAGGVVGALVGLGLLAYGWKWASTSPTFANFGTGGDKRRGGAGAAAGATGSAYASLTSETGGYA